VAVLQTYLVIDLVDCQHDDVYLLIPFVLLIYEFGEYGTRVQLVIPAVLLVEEGQEIYE